MHSQSAHHGCTFYQSTLHLLGLHGQSMLLLCSSQGGAALQDVILQTASIVLRSNSASDGQHALMTMLAHIAHCLDETAAGELN